MPMTHLSLIHKQTGGATLMMSLVLVVTLGLMSIYSAQVTVTEQKISSNHYRTKQGFEAAQAGLDAIMAQLNVAFVNQVTTDGATANTANLTNAGITLPTLSNGGNTGNTQAIGTYSVEFNKSVSNPEMVNIMISGFAGDNQSNSPNQVITQSVLPISLMTYTPPTSIVARGKIQIGNNVSIINKTNSPTNDLPKATWSGGVTTTNTGGSSASIDVISQDGTLDGGSGIYEKDTALSNLSNDDFFKNFFSESKERIKNKSKAIDCSSGCTGSDLIDSNGDPVAQMIWITTSNSGGAPGKLVIDSPITLGSASNPVLLIVDGKIEINDINANFNGLIYTTQNFKNNAGAGNINGSLISEGDISATGELKITYNKNQLLTLKNNTSHYVRVAGSWKDF